MNIHCAVPDCAWNDGGLCKFPIGLVSDRGICMGFDHGLPNPTMWHAPVELHCQNEFCVYQDRSRTLCQSPDPSFDEKSQCMTFQMRPKSELAVLREMVEKIANISRDTLREAEDTKVYVVNGMCSLSKEKDAGQDVYGILQSINAAIGAFIDKYADLLDRLAVTREKEEIVLDELKQYLSRYV